MRLSTAIASVAAAFVLVPHRTIADPLVGHATSNCGQLALREFYLEILPHQQPVTNAKALILTQEYGRFSHEYFYWLTRRSNDIIPASPLTLSNGNLHAILQNSTDSSTSQLLHLASESMPPQQYILFNTSTNSAPGHLSLAETPVGCALALRGVADQWGFCSAVYSEHKGKITLNCNPRQGLKWLLARPT